MKKSKKVLGKGLQALIGENETTVDAGRTFEVNMKDIRPNESQPRKNMVAIDELTDSIKAHGLIQPIVVCNQSSGKYQIVAGERRWLAAKKSRHGENTCCN